MGNLVGLTQYGASVAIDTIDSTGFSDFNIDNGVYSRLNNVLNWQFYLNAMTNFSSYQSNFTISHSYSNAGLYNMSITILSSGVTYYQTVYVTDSKFN